MTATVVLPELVLLATERAERAGFTMSCDPGTGRLLAVLAAAVPCSIIPISPVWKLPGQPD
jgi:hypothetical protein